MYGKQFIFFQLGQLTRIFIRPNILTQVLFAIIKWCQGESTEQVECQVHWLSLKYQAHDLILMQSTDDPMSVISDAVVCTLVVFFIYFFHATWIIETGLLNATRTINGYYFDIVSQTVARTAVLKTDRGELSKMDFYPFLLGILAINIIL